MNTGTNLKNSIQRCSTGSCEVFKDIPGWENMYQVSNIGRVKSLSRAIVSCTGKIYNRKERFLKQCMTFDGYKKGYLSRDGKDYHFGVHRLIAMAFISNPDNKPMVNHLNAIRTDNRVENLEWCTNAENVQHSFDLGISDNKGDKHPRRVLTMEIVRSIRKELSNGKTPQEVADIIGIKRRNVYAVRDRQNWNYD